MLAGVQRDRGVEIGEVLIPGNVGQSKAIVVGVVVIVAPLESVFADNLGHVVPEFDDDIVRTVRGADTPTGHVGKILYGKVEVAIGPVGYANALLFPPRRHGGNSVALGGAFIGAIRSVVLPPVVAARVEAVQPGRRQRVVVTEAINVRAVVAGIA